MSLLITGGTGFLGSHLARYLVREKEWSDIVLTDAYPNADRVADLLDDVTVVQGDITQPQELHAVMVRHGIDQIVHLAGIIGDPPDPDRLMSYFKVQCQGTANVFDAARVHGLRRVVYSSSGAVYGPPPRSPANGSAHGARALDEDAPTAPNTFYGSCKLWCENIAALYAKRYGLETIGLRPISVMGLGRRERGSYASGLGQQTSAKIDLPSVPERALAGEAVVLPPDDCLIDWIYADDAAEGWYRALVSELPEHRVFNLSAGQRPAGELTAALRKVLPDASITIGTSAGLSAGLVSNERIKTELQFEPRHTFETALEDYVRRAKEQR